MRVIMNLVVTAVAAGALSTMPAAAQYPAYGYAYPGYGRAYPDANGTQIAINRCADAVQAQLGGAAYGRADGGGRVLGISGVYPGGYGGAVTVRGVASSGGNGREAYGSPVAVDLNWQCTADYRGLITGLSIQPVRRPYGNQGYRPAPYGNNDYSQYGYYRY